MPWFCRNRLSQWFSCVFDVREPMVPLYDDTHTCEISVRSAVETMLSRWLPCIEDMRKSMVPPHFHTFTIEIA